MFDIVPSGMLTRYYNLIEELLNRCPDAWGVIYQADVRTRNEHFPRVLAEVLAHHARKEAKGKGDQSGSTLRSLGTPCSVASVARRRNRGGMIPSKFLFKVWCRGAAKVDKFIDAAGHPSSRTSSWS